MSNQRRWWQALVGQIGGTSGASASGYSPSPADDVLNAVEHTATESSNVGPAGNAAFNIESVNNESVNKESVNKESVSNEPLRKESFTKESQEAFTQTIPRVFHQAIYERRKRSTGRYEHAGNRTEGTHAVARGELCGA